MKKLITTITWLMFATASHGEAGQHTGVGGNPAVPPPQPVSADISGLVFQTFIIQPGMMIILPVADQAPALDPVKDENTKTDEGDQ